jgi:adenylate cyclase class IV
MTRSIEIELKFEVLDHEQIERFASVLKPIEAKHIEDVYLDTDNGGLFKRGIFMRIRNSEKFDIKFNLEDMTKTLDDTMDHTHCDEVSIALPFTSSTLATTNETLATLGLDTMSEPSLEDLKTRNYLTESMAIDKQRLSYSAGDFRIDIDMVQNLGEYLEIEKMADERADRDRIISQMHQQLSGLALRHVDVGYNELYWRKHNFELYLLGKYLLFEDRLKYRPNTISK